MTSSPLNPSQHVERIREILIGRDLQNMHGRLSRIEGALEKSPPSQDPSQVEASLARLKEEQTALREELQVQKLEKKDFPPHNEPAPTASVANGLTALQAQLSSEMAAHIDARYREILSHLEKELAKLKGEFNEEVHDLNFSKADRSELSERFTRLATAVSAATSPPAQNDGETSEAYFA